MSTEQIYVYFTASKEGKTGLTPTIDVFQIVRVTGVTTQIVTNGNMTAIGGGGYRYALSSVDILTNDYFYIAKTTDTSVDQKHLPGLKTLANSHLISTSTNQDNLVYLFSANASSQADYIAEFFNGASGTIYDDVQGLINIGNTLRILSTNKTIADPITHTQKVYNDAGDAVFVSALIYEDPEAQIPYRGQGISRREKFQ